MPQARLPDINAAFTKHRNEVISSLKSGGYDAVFGALYSLNALLPEEPVEDGFPKYRVVVSDIDYKRLTQPKTFCTCYHCNSKSNYDDVIVFDMLLPAIEQIMNNKKSSKSWMCPICKEICKIRQDDFSETVVKEPSFMGVVPKPPMRQEGLMDRTSYHNKITQWAWTMLTELENKMACFRDDNWTKNEKFSDSEEMDEGLES